jgi:hypothetical protein
VRTYTDKPHFTHSDTPCKPDGSFVVTALPPGAEGWILVRAASGYVPAFDAPAGHGSFRQDGEVLRFTGLPAGRHDGLVIRLLKAVTVTGVVRDDEGKPVPSLRGVVRPGGRLIRTNADGRYEAAVAPDADVTLEFSAGDKEPVLATASLRAAEGQRVEKDLVVARPPPAP